MHSTSSSVLTARHNSQHHQQQHYARSSSPKPPMLSFRSSSPPSAPHRSSTTTITSPPNSSLTTNHLLGNSFSLSSPSSSSSSCEGKIRNFNRKYRWFFPGLTILFCVFVSYWITFRFPHLKLSDFSRSTVEWLDPNYLTQHHGEPESRYLLSTTKSSTSSVAASSSSTSTAKCSVLLEKKRKVRKNSNHHYNNNNDVHVFENNIEQDDIFRTVIFSDLHSGEDGKLDELTLQFQQKVFEEAANEQHKNMNDNIHTKTQNYFDLIVVLGDVVSQSDYLWLRNPDGTISDVERDAAFEKKTPEQMEHRRKAAKSLTSCLSQNNDDGNNKNNNNHNDKNMPPASKCWQSLHENLLQQDTPIVSIFGNHDAPTRGFHFPDDAHDQGDNNNGNTKTHTASLKMLSQDLHSYALNRLGAENASKVFPCFPLMSSMTSKNYNKNKILAQQHNPDKMCSLLFVSKRTNNVDDDENDDDIDVVNNNNHQHHEDCYSFAVNKLRHGMMDHIELNEQLDQIRESQKLKQQRQKLKLQQQQQQLLLSSAKNSNKNKKRNSINNKLHHQLLDHSIDAHLMFFNSVSDETDTLLLHGYKYSSKNQLREAKQVINFLEENQFEQDDEREEQKYRIHQHKNHQKNNNKMKKNIVNDNNNNNGMNQFSFDHGALDNRHDSPDYFEEAEHQAEHRPLQIAFVHIPSSLYLRHNFVDNSNNNNINNIDNNNNNNDHPQQQTSSSSSSLLLISGSHNETAGCSPRDLPGTQRFADFILTSTAPKPKSHNKNAVSSSSSLSHHKNNGDPKNENHHNDNDDNEDEHDDDDDDDPLFSSEHEEEEEMLRARRNTKVDILISGHDHKNDFWSVHDREKLALYTDVLSPKRKAKLLKDLEKKQNNKFIKNKNKKKLSSPSSSSPPLHLAYARHSGFGGYFDLRSSQLPGVRILEISKVKLKTLKPMMMEDTINNDDNNNKNEKNTKYILYRQEQEYYCSQVRRAFPDLKFCRLQEIAVLKDVNVDDDNIDNDDVEQVDERYLIIVRSWIWEAVLSKSSSSLTSSRVSLSKQEEHHLKQDEYHERLYHVPLRGLSVTGVRRDDQVLETPKSRRNRQQIKKQFGSSSASTIDTVDEECDAVIDFRSHHRIVAIVCWIFTIWVIAGFWYFERIVARHKILRAEQQRNMMMMQKHKSEVFTE